MRPMVLWVSCELFPQEEKIYARRREIALLDTIGSHVQNTSIVESAELIMEKNHSSRQNVKGDAKTFSFG